MKRTLKTTMLTDTLRNLYLFLKYPAQRPGFLDREFFHLIESEGSTPPFLGSAVQSTLIENGDRSFSCLPSQSSFRIESNEHIGEVSFSLIDCGELQSAEINMEFLHSDGRTSQRNVDFTNGKHGGWSWIPVSLSVPGAEVVKLKVNATTVISSGKSYRHKILSTLLPIKPDLEPWLSTPAMRPKASDQAGPPIVVVSVDSLRYDALEHMNSLIDAFDDKAVVPPEPRTQGHFTRPSHGSLFTGMYPGDHGYYSRNSRVNQNSITLPQFLRNNSYKCSACTSLEGLRPRYGLSEGFHRFENKQISWKDRSGDAAEIINTATRWLDRDVKEGVANQLFYFIQITDVHYPYFDPWEVSDGGLNLESIESYGEVSKAAGDYLARMTEDVENPPSELIEQVRAHYPQSVQSVSDQLCRLIGALKAKDIFNDSFVVITGDHGEEFFERGFGTHNTLYDANIRPAMIIKSPDNIDLNVPSDPDFIDFFPTIARIIGDTPPAQCQGTAWQHKQSKDYRIAERIREVSYSLSVESEGYKGIFTYATDGYGRPSSLRLEDGRDLEEFYSLSSIRQDLNTASKSDVPQDIREDLENQAESFLAHQSAPTRVDEENIVPSPGVKKRLNDLGYK